MRERVATATLGGRFTRYNLRIERSLAAADQCGSSSTSSKARVVGFKHCHDLVQVGCCVCVRCVGNMEANTPAWFGVSTPEHCTEALMMCC
jgi:hypothetical protein